MGRVGAAQTLNENPYRGFESLPLRQQVIDFTERIVTSGICATFPAVSAGIRESSQLRARISPYFSDQRGQFSERHFASAVLVANLMWPPLLARVLARFRRHWSPRLPGYCFFQVVEG